MSKPDPKRAWQWLSLLIILLAIGACFHWHGQPAIAGAALPRISLRSAIVVLALLGWFRSQALIGSRALKDGAITDTIHEMTATAHRYLQNHPKQADRLLIVTSGFIDAFGLFLIGASIFGPTMRPFVALLILFVMRQVCQTVCALPIPRDMIWRYPGSPSLLVTYGTANDFFFSGHTAIAVLGAIEVARLGPAWLGIAAGVIALLEVVTVLVLRAHYTIDILGALLATGCALQLADWVCKLL